MRFAEQVGPLSENGAGRRRLEKLDGAITTLFMAPAR